MEIVATALLVGLVFFLVCHAVFISYFRQKERFADRLIRKIQQRGLPNGKN